MLRMTAAMTSCRRIHEVVEAGIDSKGLEASGEILEDAKDKE